MKRTLKRLRNLGEVLLWFFFGGCAANQQPAAKAQAQTTVAAAVAMQKCSEAINELREKANTCPQFQLWVDSDPNCRPFLPINLDCPEFRK